MSMIENLYTVTRSPKIEPSDSGKHDAEEAPQNEERKYNRLRKEEEKRQRENARLEPSLNLALPTGTGTVERRLEGRLALWAY